MIGQTEKNPNKYDLFERVDRTNSLLSKKNVAAQLRFAKLHVNNPHNFWNNVN